MMEIPGEKLKLSNVWTNFDEFEDLCLVSDENSLPYFNSPDFSSKSGADRRAQGFHRTRTGYADRE